MEGNEEELLKDEGYALMGAAFEVYNHLGAGFLGEVYLINFGAAPRLQWSRRVL